MSSLPKIATGRFGPQLEALALRIMDPNLAQDAYRAATTELKTLLSKERSAFTQPLGIPQALPDLQGRARLAQSLFQYTDQVYPSIDLYHTLLKITAPSPESLSLGEQTVSSLDLFRYVSGCQNYLAEPGKQNSTLLKSLLDSLAFFATQIDTVTKNLREPVDATQNMQQGIKHLFDYERHPKDHVLNLHQDSFKIGTESVSAENLVAYCQNLLHASEPNLSLKKPELSDDQRQFIEQANALGRTVNTWKAVWERLLTDLPPRDSHAGSIPDYTSRGTQRVVTEGPHDVPYAKLTPLKKG